MCLLQLLLMLQESTINAQDGVCNSCWRAESSSKFLPWKVASQSWPLFPSQEHLLKCLWRSGKPLATSVRTCREAGETAAMDRSFCTKSFTLGAISNMAGAASVYSANKVDRCVEASMLAATLCSTDLVLLLPMAFLTNFTCSWGTEAAQRLRRQHKVLPSNLQGLGTLFVTGLSR